VVVAFLAWSGNLLLRVTQTRAQLSDLHDIGAGLDNLSSTWRNLNRPGNDVLEKYEVEENKQDLETYITKHKMARQALAALEGKYKDIREFLDRFDIDANRMIARAQSVLRFAEERQKLVTAGGSEAEVRQKENEAASQMALMDQSFQRGLDLIEGEKRVIGERENALFIGQRKNVNSLYLLLFVALGSMGLCAEFIRRSVRQREQVSKAMGEVAASENRVRAVVNNIVDGIITIDEQGRIESFNPSAERIFGYTAAEVAGQNVKLLMPEPYHGEHDGYLANYLRTGKAKIIGIGREVTGKRKDGSTFPLSLAVSEMRVGERRMFTGVVRDISERKLAEQRAATQHAVTRVLAEAASLPEGTVTCAALNCGMRRPATSASSSPRPGRSPFPRAPACPAASGAAASRRGFAMWSKTPTSPAPRSRTRWGCTARSVSRSARPTRSSASSNSSATRSASPTMTCCR
jgi:PAS domain S-box-containing protein